MIECCIVGCDVDSIPGFSGKLFAVSIYYFEVGDVGTRVVVDFTEDVKCTGYMPAMFFHSIF